MDCRGKSTNLAGCTNMYIWVELIPVCVLCRRIDLYCSLGWAFALEPCVILLVILRLLCFRSLNRFPRAHALQIRGSKYTPQAKLEISNGFLQLAVQNISSPLSLLLDQKLIGHNPRENSWCRNCRHDKLASPMWEGKGKLYWGATFFLSKETTNLYTNLCSLPFLNNYQSNTKI